MSKKLRSIMLVDDDCYDNYFHEREIKKTNPAISVIEKTSGLDALEFLISNIGNKELLPDLIFLDINMPVMDGWMFLEASQKLDKELQDSFIIIMLSTSLNSEDIVRAMTYSNVSDYITKPLTREIMDNIISRFFNGSFI
jgi:CheY-like chemotaxis protein